MLLIVNQILLLMNVIRFEDLKGQHSHHCKSINSQPEENECDFGEKCWRSPLHPHKYYLCRWCFCYKPLLLVADKTNQEGLITWRTNVHRIYPQWKLQRGTITAFAWYFQNTYIKYHFNLLHNVIRSLMKCKK